MNANTTETTDDTELTTDQLAEKLGIELIDSGTPYTKKPIPDAWKQIFRAPGDSYGNIHGELWQHPEGFYVHTGENMDGLRYIHQVGEWVTFDGIVDSSEELFDNPSDTVTFWELSDEDREQYQQHAEAIAEDDEALRETVADVIHNTVMGDYGAYDAHWSGDVISIETLWDGFSDAEHVAAQAGARDHNMSARIVLTDDY